MSVGLPVRNGGGDLRQALEALLAQDFGDFEVILSENASTDETPAVAAEFAARDGRVRVIRQARNIGAARNFGFVLAQAQGEYFMWAAADDRWHPDYIASNLRVLQKQAEAVASASRVRMRIPASKSPSYIGTFPLAGSYAEKLKRYLAEPGQNSRFYGLFRTAALRRSFVACSFVGADWATIVRVLRHGDFHELDAELMERGASGESTLLYANRRLSRPRSMFPLADFTRWLWRELPKSLFLRLLPQVLEQNGRFTYTALTARR